MTTVAVDAMGGDAAPAVVVDGAVAAALVGGALEGGLRILLVGDEAVIRGHLARHAAMGVDVAALAIEVVHADDAVTMADSPAAVIKGKPRSSIHVGLGLHRDGRADAFVSAGNTGAVMAVSLFVLGRAKGVARPTLAGFYPTVKGRCLLVDVGSNVDCKPEHLVQFARMGSTYLERAGGVAAPTVGLMNVGEEPGKGNEQAKEAYDLLAAAPGIVFIGNIEGGDLMMHAADVVVTDGFVGNVTLKLGESLTKVLPILAGQAIERLGMGEAETAAAALIFGEIKKPFDYQNFGGAPLLGVAGSVLIGHGSSSAAAITRMITAGAELAAQGVTAAIAATIGGRG